MKIKFLPVLVCTFVATSLFFSSCLNDNEDEEIILPAESSIQSFSIGTVSIPRIGKDTLGKDTTFIDTVSCAHYPFTIDQLQRRIENKDSLPVGSDVSKLLVKIVADSDGIMYERREKNGDVKDTLWTSTDSIDFTRPVAFKVFAMNGMMGRSYIVKVNVHKQNPDTLEWSHFTAPQFASGKLNKQKSLVLNNQLYTVGVKDDNTKVLETVSIDGKPSSWELVTTLPDGTNTYSFQIWNGNLCFVADGKLYRLNAAANYTVEQIGEQTNIRTLVGLGNIDANEEVMFAYNTNDKIVALAEDGSLAREQEFGFIDNNGFVAERMSSASIAARHNKSLTRTIVMSNNPSTLVNDSTACVFGYTTHDTEWGRISMPNPIPCPNLENISMIRYDNKLYAFGGGIETKNIKPFEYFYCSTDNGLTWKKVTKSITFPKEDSERHPDVRPFANYYTANVEGSYSVTVDQKHFIWFVWENGNVTKGRLNRLGFANKW